MSQRFNQWLQAWGDWLDSLLATGIGSASQETQGRIQQWCVDAELLGFATQVQQARLLLSAEVPVVQRHRAFLDLLLEHDMLLRLNDAQALLEHNGQDEAME